jgi:putative acetyltransferase
MPERPFKIREATHDDLAKVVDCLHAAFAPYEGTYTPEAYRNTTLSLSTMEERFAATLVLVATDDDEEIVGTISLRQEPDSSGHLRGMAVAPGCQGTGVAAALLGAAEHSLRERRCLSVHLETTKPLHRAMRFYERCGFRRTGRVTDFFGMTLIEYSKDL